MPPEFKHVTVEYVEEMREHFFPHFLRPKILILTDSDGSFTHEHRFGLTELVKTLQTGSIATSYEVVTAHRRKESAGFPYPKDAQIKEFRFDNPKHFQPDDYDQVWLIGIATPSEPDPELNDAELKVLANFMQSGGGVFATGDHEDLGAALNSRIPRVRSMRKWKYDHSLDRYSNFPENSDIAPPVMGPHRHETLVPSTIYQKTTNIIPFDNQSDDLPQRIQPFLYTFSWIKGIGGWIYPHPVLCSPRGPIDVLPDHMHEGSCIVPGKLNEKFKILDLEFDEYPKNPFNEQIIPEIIAEGTVRRGSRSTLKNKDFNPVPGNPQDDYLFGNSSTIDSPTQYDTFGTIGVYNGHFAKVGRVVVDSTFHHFVNINLTGAGSNNPPGSVKSLGFYASPDGQDQLEQIKTYYRNIAIYLSRPENQRSFFDRLFWLSRWDSQVRMLPPVDAGRVRSYPYFRDYGRAVLTSLARFATPCLAFVSTLELQYEFAPPWRYVHPCPWDPIIFKGRQVLPDPQGSLDVGEYLAGVAATTMSGLVAETREHDEVMSERMQELVREMRPPPARGTATACCAPRNRA